MLDKPKPKQLELEPQEMRPRVIYDPNDGRPLAQNGGGEIIDPGHLPDKLSDKQPSLMEAMSMAERPLAASGPQDFDWSLDGPNADDIVCPRQPATAVYINVHGSIVIRQERNWCEEEDPIAVIAPDNAGAITDAIMKLAREAK